VKNKYFNSQTAIVPCPCILSDFSQKNHFCGVKDTLRRDFIQSHYMTVRGTHLSLSS